MNLSHYRHRRSIKLSPEKAALIRQRAQETTHARVAREFGIGLSLVGKIVRGENWA